MEAGYVSSELWGSVNLEVERSACVPTITDAFFEFVERNDWENDRHAFQTLDEIEEGQQYYVFVTTTNGLYRYDMNDIVAMTQQHVSDEIIMGQIRSSSRSRDRVWMYTESRTAPQTSCCSWR